MVAFLQQLMRMPASAAVNIVEQEDAQRVYEEVGSLTHSLDSAWEAKGGVPGQV